LVDIVGWLFFVCGLSCLILDDGDNEVGVEGAEADRCSESEEVCSAGGVDGAANERVLCGGCENPAGIGRIELWVDSGFARFSDDACAGSLGLVIGEMFQEREGVFILIAGRVSILDFILHESEY